MHGCLGEHTQALSLYESLRRRLSRDLGIRPEPATLAVYEAIRRRRAAAGSSGEERSEDGDGERSGDGPDFPPAALVEDLRSEARRVGKEWVRTCSTRGAPAT